jgi:murein DD-endopeptidase MepM/ murein hydrolase activator NlpD
MAYQSSYGSNHPYARDSFGRRHPDYGMPAASGVSRGAYLTTLCAAVLFAVWSGVATVFLVFGDGVVQRIALTRSETSRAQDAQIAALTTEIERLRSSKFVDQEKVDRQLSDLANIQRMIDARQKALGALTQSFNRNPDITGSVPANTLPPASQPATDKDQDAQKPRPLSDTFLVDPPRDRPASMQSRINVPRQPAIAAGAGAKGKHDIASAAHALAKLSAQQAQALNAIEIDLDQRAARVKKAITELGIRPSAASLRATAVGGPYVPFNGVPEDAYMRQVFRVRLATAEHERLAKQLDGLPVVLPVRGPAEITSGFGLRVDPFIKRLALHSGVDIRGDTGDRVLAAAAGTVVTAERHKAYGLMVEIDHGNGLSTRYAHLSAITVKEGAKVPAGAAIGKIGSTGRSTAPHLHFEVRQNGDAIDPRRYIRAAKTLAGFQ